MNIARWIDRWAGMEPGRVALDYEDRHLTYADLADRIARLSSLLADRLGIRQGDRIAHLGKNDPEILTLVFACARLGAIYVPLNWRLAVPELDYILGNAEPAALFADGEFAATAESLKNAPGAGRRIIWGAARPGWLEHEAEMRAARPIGDGAGAGDRSDALMIVYTSGTTGRPKGAVLTQDAIFHTAVNGMLAFGLTARDISLNALPMFHVGGLNIQCLPLLHAGGRVIIHRVFDPGRALQTIAQRRVTLFIAVPAMLAALLAHPDWAGADLSSLRNLCTGASTVPESMVQAVLARGLAINQVYGTTETAPTVAYTLPGVTGKRAASCGQPAMHAALKVVDEQGCELGVGQTGELWAKGPNIMREYWRDPVATAEALVDGWFRTGDLAHRDQDGFYYIDDRLKDVIISGGENIYSAELEQVLAECPKIAESAVVAGPDPRWTEVPVAVIVAKPGQKLEADEVLALFEGRLARYKHPKRVVFAQALPRNAMGKVLKYVLRDQVKESHS